MATDETASTIAKALGESEEQPVSQITGVIRALGEEVAQTLLQETLLIESKGGMLLPDNSRRRTPGGVFFHLARQKLSRDDKLAIFRAPKEPKGPGSSSPASESSPYPRRRVIEVAPSNRTPSRPPSRPGFVPPDLPDAVRRVKAKEALLSAVAGFPRETQYELLLDVLASLHHDLGYRVGDQPRSSAAFDPPTRPGALIAEPPSSQRPIPVTIPVAIPESTRRTSERPMAEEEKPEAPPPPRRAGGSRATSSRTTTVSKRR
jgi:hypothetical protein